MKPLGSSCVKKWGARGRLGGSLVRRDEEPLVPTLVRSGNLNDRQRVPRAADSPRARGRGGPHLCGPRHCVAPGSSHVRNERTRARSASQPRRSGTRGTREQHHEPKPGVRTGNGTRRSDTRRSAWIWWSARAGRGGAGSLAFRRTVLAEEEDQLLISQDLRRIEG